jgi:(2Fe-2S) ferredoxin
MKRPTFHILVCNSFRTSGEPQGVCHKKDAIDLLPLLEEGLVERGLDALVSTTGCLKVCDRGPALVIHPNNWWYGNVTEDKIEEILDALVEGRAVDEYLIA